MMVAEDRISMRIESDHPRARRKPEWSRARVGGVRGSEPEGGDAGIDANLGNPHRVLFLAT